MYNIFKRPMFKLGGQADQGSGIMSTVEPKQTMIQNPYTGYAIGGRIMAQGGYDPRGTYFGPGPDPRGTYFGPGSRSTGTTGMFDPFNPNPKPTTGLPAAEERGLAARQKIAEQATRFGKSIPKATSTALGFTRGFLGPALTGGLGVTGLIAAPIATVGALAYAGRPRNQSELNYIKDTIPPSEASGEGDYDAYMAGKTEAYNEGVAKGEKELTFFEGITKPKKTEVIDTTSSVDTVTGDRVDKTTAEIINSKDTSDSKTEAVKPAVYKETDRRDNIRKEMEFLKEELGDDIGAGELALIASQAIATPGTIADKIKAATQLAIPIAQQRRKDKKAIALRAYETITDKEKAEIAAGKKGELGQLIDQYVEGKRAEGDKRKEAIIKKEFIEERYLGAGKEESALEKVIFKADYDNEIRPAIVRLNKFERQKQLTGKLSKDEQNTLNEAKDVINKAVKKYPQFKKFITPETLAAGGRIGLAEGTPELMIEQNTQPESIIEQTVIKEGPSDVSIKPVNKLSYPELRDRLPKEITNDIVQLIASSEEALQEFAYIRTQRDINDFNVKYGVNLILPATR